MQKNIRSVRISRKPLLSRIATILMLSGIFCLAACVQASTPASQTASPARQGLGTIASPLPLATQEPEGTSPRLETPAAQPSATAFRPLPTLPGGLKRVEQTPGTPAAGEVPASLLKEIVQDLSVRLKVGSEKIELIKSEEVVWNDGSLGCPQPGMFYTQALVNGYWLILEVDNIPYDYRASDRDFFFLCERPSPPALATQPDGT